MSSRGRQLAAAFATIQQGIPSGTVAYFGMASAPTGWLSCDGSAVSRTTYAALFAVIGTTFGVGNGSTTFNLPDLRGEFIRGLDGGRGVDTNRVLGSAQAEATKSHTHTGTAASAGAHTHDITTGDLTAGSTRRISANEVTNTGTRVNGAAASAGAHTHSLTIDPTGGTETRPRNVAMLACIKT